MRMESGFGGVDAEGVGHARGREGGGATSAQARRKARRKTRPLSGRHWLGGGARSFNVQGYDTATKRVQREAGVSAKCCGAVPMRDGAFRAVKLQDERAMRGEVTLDARLGEALRLCVQVQSVFREQRALDLFVGCVAEARRKDASVIGEV